MSEDASSMGSGSSWLYLVGDEGGKASGESGELSMISCVEREFLGVLGLSKAGVGKPVPVVHVTLSEDGGGFEDEENRGVA